MSYYAEQMAEWATSLRIEDVPQDVLDTAKHCLSDWVGIGIYGSLSPWSQVARDIVREHGGREEATILVDGLKVPAHNAALANGIMALSYDISDTFLETALHPSCGVIAAALATAERVRADGKALLTSIVAGYEITSRLARALNKPPKRVASSKGFESNAMIPSFGATVAAGKLLGLNQDQMSNALGLCSCSLTGGLIEYLLDGNWTYRWNGGRAGHDGVLNTLMAQKGFFGPHAVFEGQWDDKGRYGILNAFTGSIETAEELTRDLGQQWHLKGIGFKYYACCHYIHGFTNGVLDIMKGNRIAPEQIEEITCYLPHMTLFLAVPKRIKYKPANLTVAQWSLPFCLATAVMDGHLLHPADQFSEERLNDATVLGLAQRVKGVLNEELDELVREQNILRSPFKLTLKDGRDYEGSCDCKGFPYNPLTQEEVANKFNTLVSPILGEDRTKNLFSTLERVKETGDITSLVGAMCRR